MDHSVELAFRADAFHRFRVPHVGLVDGETRIGCQQSGVGPLAGGVVVVIEVIKAGDTVAARQECLGDVAADEAGRAGDQNVHFSPIRYSLISLIKHLSLFQNLVDKLD